MGTSPLYPLWHSFFFISISHSLTSSKMWRLILNYLEGNLKSQHKQTLEKMENAPFMLSTSTEVDRCRRGLIFLKCCKAQTSASTAMHWSVHGYVSPQLVHFSLTFSFQPMCTRFRSVGIVYSFSVHIWLDLGC